MAASTTHRELYSWEVMLFGLKNTRPTCQRKMNQVPTLCHGGHEVHIQWCHSMGNINRYKSRS